MTIQLTLEQHRFELWRSIYTCIFCNKYTHNPGLVESMDAESLVWRANYGILATKNFVIHSKSWNQYSHSSVQSLSCVQLFVTPWTAAHQASLSITNSRSPPKPMSIASVMPSNHLILCRPLLLLPSIFPSIRVLSNESALCIRWPKYWSFQCLHSVLPSGYVFMVSVTNLGPINADSWYVGGDCLLGSKC